MTKADEQAKRNDSASVVVCPDDECVWVSPEFDDRVLHERSRAMAMWREHWRSEHTPAPQVQRIPGGETPHV